MTKEQLETYKNTYDRYDGISNNEFDSICDELIAYKQLEEQIGCPLEKFLTTNEIYSDLEDGTIKKYEIIGINFCEKKIYFWMSFVPMNVDFIDYKKYYWLKEDKSE